ncbi:hypothetical protein H0H92_009572 [Tricholoma furcatifolium]|nr:hypothetical protein H0H92_009572 [Tricholoma furcatifolium]
MDSPTTGKRFLRDLHITAFTYPAIDNHAHPLLRAENRADIPFECLISHLDGETLIKDAPYTLACHRATRQLAKLFDMEQSSSWDDIKAKREDLEYTELCKLCFAPSGIQCILIDDGFGGTDSVHEIAWHDQFTHNHSKRVVRIEPAAEVRRLFVSHDESSELMLGILKAILKRVFANYQGNEMAFHEFSSQLKHYLVHQADDPFNVGFKTVVCYRTGLAVSPKPPSLEELLPAISILYEKSKTRPETRLQEKVLNDYVVHLAMSVSAEHATPIQFHTGLGDNDMLLDLGAPKHLEPLIKAYPNSKIVLLHASYPYSREAGYLTAIHPNVYLDFGEIFPYISGGGQRAVIREILEVVPTNKIMWSSTPSYGCDGHTRPESFYLGALQAREALYEVLNEIVQVGELSEAAAVRIVQNALFHNANALYKLNLEPNTSFTRRVSLRFCRVSISGAETPNSNYDYL